MATYVISDIHGMKNSFMKMLEKIKFKKDDTLYILGDVLDRGENPISLLLYIMKEPNIILLKGNHEQFMINYFEGNDTYWEFSGGSSTLQEIKDLNLTKEKIKEIVCYLKNLPLYKKIGNTILVHAGLPIYPKSFDLDFILNITDENYMLWGRNHIGNEQLNLKFNVICGHTPTIAYFKKNKIVRAGNYIYIDCGAVFFNYGGLLACLRLEDNEEFYV